MNKKHTVLVKGNLHPEEIAEYLNQGYNLIGFSVVPLVSEILECYVFDKEE